MAETNSTSKKRRRSANDWAPRFLKRLSECGIISASCEHAGIERTTVYYRRDREPEFAAAMAEALDKSVERLELEAFRRAHDGVEKPVFHQGDECGRIREYSDTLLIFLIKRHRPEYRENYRVEHSGPGGGPIEHTFTEITDAELDSRIAELEARTLRIEAGTPTPDGPA